MSRKIHNIGFGSHAMHTFGHREILKMKCFRFPKMESKSYNTTEHFAIYFFICTTKLTKKPTTSLNYFSPIFQRLTINHWKRYGYPVGEERFPDPKGKVTRRGGIVPDAIADVSGATTTF